MPHTAMLRTLVSKGYFPSELPPVFTTEDFGNYIVNILEDWKKGQVYEFKFVGKVPGTKKIKRGSYLYKLPSADVEIISIPKRGFERRDLSIVHPVPQGLLCFELTSNWRTIQKWLSLQHFSLDRIQIGNSYKRSIKGVNFELHTAKKDYIQAVADWLVVTDNSRFYPTIYTHSIPWAAYGKHKVKSNIPLYQGSLADRIDLLVRSGNRNQTVGIPIGPETSRIIAEIISSRIDQQFSLREKLTSTHVDRLQDDWFVGVDTLEKAEVVEARADVGAAPPGSPAGKRGSARA